MSLLLHTSTMGSLTTKAEEAGVMFFEHRDMMNSSLDKVYICSSSNNRCFGRGELLTKHRNDFSSSMFVSAQNYSCLFLAHCFQEKLGFNAVVFPALTNFSSFR